MAKIGEILRFTDDIKPNAFTAEQKLQWLNELEGQIQAMVLHTPKERLRALYTLPKDMDTVAVAEHPYDKLYWMYLAAMIDYANGEYSKYQNSMIFFHDAYGEYARAYLRENGYMGPAAVLHVW